MPAKIRLTKDQLRFYSKTYSDLIKTVRLTYKDLVDCVDAEGVYFLAMALNEVAKEAQGRVKKLVKSL